SVVGGRARQGRRVDGAPTSAGGSAPAGRACGVRKPTGQVRDPARGPESADLQARLSLRTPQAPSNGAAERRQEHHALPLCVRGEELRNLVVEEGEPGGAETKCVGGQVEAAADDASLELSGPIAAIAKPG